MLSKLLARALSRRVLSAACVVALVVGLLAVGGLALADPSDGRVAPLSLAQAQGAGRNSSALIDLAQARLDQARLEEAEAALAADAVPPAYVTSYEVAMLKYLQPAQTDIERRLAEANLTAAGANLDLYVTTAYLGLLTAQRFETLALEGVARAQDYERLAGQLLAVGMAAQKDVLDAAATAAEAGVQLLQARTGLATAELAFRRLTGLTGTGPLPPLDPASVAGVGTERGLDSWRAQAAAERYEARQTAEYVALAERQLELARTYPSGTVPGWERSNRYTIPLAQAQLREAQAGQRLQLEEIDYQVQVAWLELAETTQMLDALRPAMAAALEGVRLARLRFEAGMSTSLEVLAAELSLKRVETLQVQALYQYQQASAALVHGAGPGSRPAAATGGEVR